MKLGSIAFRNIFRNIRRSLLSASAIGVAALSIVLLYSLLEGMKEDMQYNLQTYITGAVRIRNAEFSKNERLNPLHLTVEDPESLMKMLQEEEGVTGISPRISFPARIYKDEENFNALGMGVNFDTEIFYQDLGPEVIKEGRLPDTGKNEALIGYKLAQKVGVGVGDKMTILSITAARGTNAITFVLTGLAAFPLGSLNETVFYAPLDRVQYFLRMPGQVQEILVKTDNNTDPVLVAASMKEKSGVSPDLEIMDWTAISTTYSMIEMASTMYDIFALFFFVLGCSVILNTTIMVSFERMKDIH
jgi:putative ABC transport system permease protein